MKGPLPKQCRQCTAAFASGAPRGLEYGRDGPAPTAYNVKGIDWNVGEAKALLAEEEAAMAETDALIASLRQGSSACKEMIAQQEALQQSLLALPVQVA